MSKPLNIGLIGYDFMGRSHSNAYRKVSNFFDLEYHAVLKAVCAGPTFRDALETQKVCDAVLDSAKSGQWVEIA